jgi:hypothetical protein
MDVSFERWRLMPNRPLKYQSTPPVAAANMAMLIDEK